MNLFPIRTINPPIIKTKLALVTNIPPIEAILAIPLSPFDDINVINIMNIEPSIASVLGAFNPNKDQVDVLSDPKIKLDKGTQIEDDILTIHIK